MEHSLFVLNILLSHFIEDVPKWVQEMQAKEAERNRKSVALAGLASYE